MLLDNSKGNYKFLSGRGVPFSSGAVADSGYGIVHATFRPLVRLSEGYGLIERHLRDVDRAINTVCGVELRIPAPLTPAGFEEFNRAYLERIAAWGVMVDRFNPIARTNVAPAVATIDEPSLYGFYYIVPAAGVSRPAFVLAGAPEMATSADGKREIVALGDVSSEGLRRKTLCVIDNLGKVLGEMKLNWSDASAVNLYTVHNLQPLFASDLIPALGIAAHRGIRWHYSRPPVVGLELEIDCYAAQRELVLAP
ncbi:MAG: hypothetical protein ACLQAT_29870 [Candidatus Binataceae bacterium]